MSLALLANANRKKPEKFQHKEPKLITDIKKKDKEEEKPGIAEIVTKARVENLRVIYKKESTPLNEIAYKKLSNNYEMIMSLKNNNLDEKSKNLIYDMMDISDDIITTFHNISYENYWKRACYEHFNIPEVLQHGDSWKQCYAENYIKERLMSFESGDDVNELLNLFSKLKNWIFNLEIPYFSANFDISLIPKYFLNITKLELKYSPKLKELKKQKESIFLKKITRIFFT